VGWLVVGVMGLTHQVAPALRKELVVNPIHRHRHVAASIHVSVEVTAEVDQKALFLGATHGHQELHRLPALEIDGAADEIADTLGRRFGARLMIAARWKASS